MCPSSPLLNVNPVKRPARRETEMHPAIVQEITRFRMDDMQREAALQRRATRGRFPHRPVSGVSGLWVGIRHARLESKTA
jgi:hypothetical protein